MSISVLCSELRRVRFSFFYFIPELLTANPIKKPLQHKSSRKNTSPFHLTFSYTNRHIKEEVFVSIWSGQSNRGILNELNLRVGVWAEITFSRLSRISCSA